MSPPLQAVLFDAVGTLIQLREPVGETYGRFAAAHGVRLPGSRIEDGFQRIFAKAPAMAFPGESAERVRELERMWWHSRVRETFRATDQTARFADFDTFFDALFAHYGGGDAWEPTPGAASALAELRSRGLRLAVASNFDHRLPSVLQALDLRSFFDLVWGPAEAGAAKPDPAFFTTLLARLEVEPGATLHVGDDPVDDASAARAAGLRVLTVEATATLADLPARIASLDRDANPGEE
ncbi:MAG: HAD-IA family hydrolase [Deltaproteobacteria bacterium]|nr:HAD-IA family hydrolase [Deltaproteobacteria bacterium]